MSVCTISGRGPKCGGKYSLAGRNTLFTVSGGFLPEQARNRRYMRLLSGQIVNVNNVVANRIQDNLAHGMQVQLPHEVGTMSLGGLEATP